jgi:menaquinone-dependent protoporphyrinogen IX oxidase
MATTKRPQVLFVYYTYTQQALKVAEAMAAVLRDRGCEVHMAPIAFTDPRYAHRFFSFPLRHVYLDLCGLLVPQLRRETGEIRIPENAQVGDYDLICIGSPTWWLTTSMPLRSFLLSDAAGRLLAGKRFAAYVVCRRYWRNNLSTVQNLGVALGGEYIGGIHFAYLGGQVRSLLSLISYLATGEYRERYLGVKIPPTNIQPAHLEAARAFAHELAETLLAPVVV